MKNLPLAEFHPPYERFENDDKLVKTGIDLDFYCEFEDTYVCTGYLDTDEPVGVLMHGTRLAIPSSATWRIVHFFWPPNAEEMTITGCKLMNIRSLKQGLEIAAGVRIAENGNKWLPAMYHGAHCGEGNWYPIKHPHIEDAIAVASSDDFVLIRDSSGAHHALDIETQEWVEVNCEVPPVIRGMNKCDDGSVELIGEKKKTH